MAVKKRPVSPRQKMINLMYVVLMAMLALNVSNEVLKGFSLMGESLSRTTQNAVVENESLYRDLAGQLKQNPAKVRPWYEKAMRVKAMSDSLYNFAERLRWAIARAADGRNGNPDALRNQEDLEASTHVMLAPVGGQGAALRQAIGTYERGILMFIADPRQRAIISSNLSTDVPRRKDTAGQSWEEYMFESMPSIAAVTMLAKLQSDVRKAENEVLHALVSNIDVKDIRVNSLEAYVLPEKTTLFPGEKFDSRIFMAAVDTTRRPEIYVGGRKIAPDGHYSFTAGAPGEYSFSGYILTPNAAGEIIRRDFVQRYNVIAPPSGASVAADLMNVLYAGFDNPVTVAASGVDAAKINLAMSGGTLISQGRGKYTARPAKVGQDVTFTVTGTVGGRQQTLGAYTFRVRKLPDPKPFVLLGNDHFTGGKMAKGTAVGLQTLGAAIDDGLLNIPFRVLSFECVFFDRMGNRRLEPSAGAAFSEGQRNLIRSLRSGTSFYVRGVRVIGPDGLERTLDSVLEIIIS